MKTCFLQARVNEQDKEKASKILEELGTNYSAVISMLLKQIIKTRSIPFDIKSETSKERAAERIKEIIDTVSPGDTIELARKAKSPEERYYYERLGDYLLQVGQKLAIEENLY